MATGGGLRSFGNKPLGRVLLVAVGVITVAFALIYLGDLLAIATFLLFGLAVPIYLGVKRPRILAIMGIVIILLAAPLASVLLTEMTFQPGPAVDSFGENGGPVLQNASVHPFSSGGGSTFTFTVVVVPAHAYANTTLDNLTLFVSTCPYATVANESSSNCQTPYPAYTVVHPLNLTSGSPSQSVSFAQKLAGPNLYWWTMYVTYTKTAGCSANCTDYIFLSPSGGYTDVQGPVAGDFLAVLGIVIVPVFLAFLYPAIAFFAALLFYMWFKGREARRTRPMPTSSPPPSVPAAGGTASLPAAAVSERHCPSCQAVVYENESQCWKCGAPLSPKSPGTPLASSGQGPAS